MIHPILKIVGVSATTLSDSEKSFLDKDDYSQWINEKLRMLDV